MYRNFYLHAVWLAVKIRLLLLLPIWKSASCRCWCPFDKFITLTTWSNLHLFYLHSDSWIFFKVLQVPYELGVCSCFAQKNMVICDAKRGLRCTRCKWSLTFVTFFYILVQQIWEWTTKRRFINHDYFLIKREANIKHHLSAINKLRKREKRYFTAASMRFRGNKWANVQRKWLMKPNWKGPFALWET